MNRWQFVLHQRALEEIDGLRPAERREVRALLLRLVSDPWQRPDAQIRPPNDRAYFVKNVGSVRVIYWLDAFAREVYVVRVERL
jgi:mRNA-degrading endonuclease RelE of RelBE toxin-antitoxin system